MVKDREKPILTYLKLGKWRLTDVEPTHRLGGLVVDGKCPPKTPFLVTIE